LLDVFTSINAGRKKILHGWRKIFSQLEKKIKIYRTKN